MSSGSDRQLAEETALLLLRAERLRKRPEESDEEAALWLAEFPLGEERYAIRLDALRACVPLRRVQSVPLAPPYVIGILQFEGRLLTALSLAARLGVRGWRRDPAILLVVEIGAGRLAAIDAEAIPRPMTLPGAMAERAATTSPVSEIVLGGGAPLQLVDVQLLFGGAPSGIAKRVAEGRRVD